MDSSESNKRADMLSRFIGKDDLSIPPSSQRQMQFGVLMPLIDLRLTTTLSYRNIIRDLHPLVALGWMRLHRIGAVLTIGCALR